MRRCLIPLFAAALVLRIGPSGWAAPPRIEAGGLFEDGLVRGRWQPLRVSVTNPPDGTAIRGEVQVAVKDARFDTRIETYARRLTLPDGAGQAQIPVTVRVPEDGVVTLSVSVLDGRQIVARRDLDRLAVVPDRLSVLAVSEEPDALAYLRGRDLGVVRRNGLLRSTEALLAWQRQRRAVRGDRFAPLRNFGGGESVRVSSVAPAFLPERSPGLETASIVVLGDFTPDALSDAQVAALRGWTAAGGLLVVASPRIGADERFRSWMPAHIASEETPGMNRTGIAVRALVPRSGARLERASGFPLTQGRVGRGSVVALGVDPMGTAFASWPGAERFWRGVAARGVTMGPAIVRGLTSDENPWIVSEFFASVLRAPNLRAPAFGWIGLFLIAYLLLLVPVNYAILRRLDRREWTWLTVPALVLVFSLGAYGFGYAVKGGRLRLNTATIVEMGAGEGQGALLGSVGLFSPRRAAYAVALADPDALLFGPDMANRSRAEQSPLLVSQENDGAHARDADVAMWAMRVFGARSTARVGEGVRVRLARGPKGTVTGTVENRTGRALEAVTVHADNWSRTLGMLPDGGTLAVRLGRNEPGVRQQNNGDVWQPFNVGWNGDRRLSTREGIRGNIQAAIQNLQNNRQGNGWDGPPAVVTAWNYAPLLPLRVDGRAVPEGDHVNLLIIHAPFPRQDGGSR